MSARCNKVDRALLYLILYTVTSDIFFCGFELDLQMAVSKEKCRICIAEQKGRKMQNRVQLDTTDTQQIREIKHSIKQHGDVQFIFIHLIKSLLLLLLLRRVLL